MEFSAGSIMVSFLVSGVGFIAFSYGRKMGRSPQMLIGLVLMIFPYFVPGILWMLAGAALLLGLLWLGVQRGL